MSSADGTGRGSAATVGAMAPSTLAGLVDLDRYPLDRPGSVGLGTVVADQRRSLAGRGVSVLPGFVTPAGVDRLVGEADRLAPLAHLSDVTGTPYLEAPADGFPDGHPRRTLVHTRLRVVAYDLIPPESTLRGLYECPEVLDFVAEVLDRRPLFRYADPLGALNLAVMAEGDELGWHFDQTDFVVSVALQSAERGGEFVTARHVRSEDDPRYDAVAGVLAGDGEGVESLPMNPGTLMIFEGRRSLHRVTPVEGPVPRYVGLLAYDTRPGTDSSATLKRIRYGRTAARS